MVKQDMIFGPFQGTLFTVVTLNPESNCTCREASFPIPLKYIDVTRATRTSLDIMLEKNIDDFCNVDGDRELSDSWARFTRFTILIETPPEGYTWSGWRLTRKQTISRPDSLWPEIMSEASKRREKQKRAVGKPKLDIARRLKGIHFIDPADEGDKCKMCVAS